MCIRYMYCFINLFSNRDVIWMEGDILLDEKNKTDLWIGHHVIHLTVICLMFRLSFILNIVLVNFKV